MKPWSAWPSSADWSDFFSASSSVQLGRREGSTHEQHNEISRSHPASDCSDGLSGPARAGVSTGRKHWRSLARAVLRVGVWIPFSWLPADEGTLSRDSARLRGHRWDCRPAGCLVSSDPMDRARRLVHGYRCHHHRQASHHRRADPASGCGTARTCRLWNGIAEPRATIRSGGYRRRSNFGTWDASFYASGARGVIERKSS